MKLPSETLTELGIAFSFPIEINDAKGKRTYRERSDGSLERCEYDAKGNEIYWQKWEFDANGDWTYYEDSRGLKSGTPRSAKTCEGKVVEIDGVKYELKAL